MRSNNPLSPNKRIYLDSPELQAMNTETKPHVISDPNEQSEKPQNDFAAELCRVMDFEEIITTEELVTEANKLLKEKIDGQFVRNLRSSGLKKPTSTKRPDALKAIAKVLNREVIDLFKPKPKQASAPPTDFDEWVNMTREGLQGPKAVFLMDAIDLASGAYRSSRQRR